jgi:pimeloyl-ACP methyl ester carboxylesterase
MRPIYFAHANGFPAESYQCFFKHLSGFRVDYIPVLGRADIPKSHGITHLAKEIIADVQRRYDAPVTAMGHSAGAMALLVANGMQPGLFDKLILLEPAFFHPLKRRGIELLRAIGLMDLLPIVKRAKNRRELFGSRAEAEEYFLQRPFFRSFHPECFQNYLEYALAEENGKIRLRISAGEEAAVYRAVHTRLPKAMNNLDALFIYGAKTRMLNEMDIFWWQKRFPNIPVRAINEGGHMFPLEVPAETAEVIKDFLN